MAGNFYTGTMPLDSPFYIKRQSDPLALETIQRQGADDTIKGSRQVAKSSLLVRIVEAAQQVGKKTVLLDFQQFGEAILQDAE